MYIQPNSTMQLIERHAITEGSLHMGGTDWIKRELLLHDKIGLLNLGQCIGQLHMHGTQVKSQRAETYEFLQQQGVIYEAQVPGNSQDKEVVAHLAAAEDQHALAEQQWIVAQQLPLNQKSEAYDAFRESDYRLRCHLVRAVAVDIQKNTPSTALPLIESDWLQDNSVFLRKSPVLRTVIRELPMPDESVPLQEILELRLDSEFIDKRERLWAWIRRVSVDNWTEQDLREELRHLSSEYEKYMRMNRVKFQFTSFGAVVKFGVGLIEDAVKLNFKDITDSLFTILGENVNLSAAELSAPGREVALIPHLKTVYR